MVRTYADRLAHTQKYMFMWPTHLYGWLVFSNVSLSCLPFHIIDDMMTLIYYILLASEHSLVDCKNICLDTHIDMFVHARVHCNDCVQANAFSIHDIQTKKKTNVYVCDIDFGNESWWISSRDT